MLNLDPTVLSELAGIPGVVAVKQAHDDLGELRTICAAGELAVYAGNDDLLLPVTELGGAGVISVASHLVGQEMGESTPRAPPAISSAHVPLMPTCRTSMLPSS